VEPPRPTGAIEPIYPPSARAARLEGRVVLRLTIDKEGQVTEAEIVASPDPSLGEAAREAVLRARFEPARRAGTPVRARILYAHEFHLPPEIVEQPVFVNAAARDVGAPTGETAPVAPRPAAPRAQQPIEVAVRGLSQADRLRRSAKAVVVIETKDARRESADLGEVLSRSQGIGVRRSGGLGSLSRLSLNGLTDDQIRFFLDGVPLEFAGFGLGVANVPVGLVERVETYRGVVPIQFGADALGGAVNLVSDQDRRGTHAGASYQVGSFGTYRMTLGGRHLHDKTGLFAGANVFFDQARNNYPIDVEAPDDRGRLRPVRVHRFHDAYRSFGGRLEFGVIDRPWAKRLLARVFATDFDKEIQHNIVMTVPYGEVTYGERVYGATLRYEQPNLFRARRMPVNLNALVGYSRRTVDFVDRSPWVYDWFGRRIRERVTPGEIRSDPTDQTQWDDNVLGRVELGWRVRPEHALRLAVAPTFTSRTGEDRMIRGSRDPLSARRDLLRVVTGVEYQADVFDRRLENIVFVKSYVARATSEEAPVGDVSPLLTQLTQRFGAGDALRFRFNEQLWAKASYEYATRLPRPDEIFGNGVLITPNLALEPEVSHNVNLSVTGDMRDTQAGSFRVEVNGFLRNVDRFITLLSNERFFSYQNVYSARSIGVEAALGWTSPGEYLALDGNLTYQDLRNTSTDGSFSGSAGDRIPNRPWLLANAAARLKRGDVMLRSDEISFGYNLRYVRSFFRSWESQGASGSKQVVPTQLLHSLSLTYLVRRGGATMSASVEAQNLTDEKVYDFFGVQRPGRSFFFKGTIEM